MPVTVTLAPAAAVSTIGDPTAPAGCAQTAARAVAAITTASRRARNRRLGRESLSIGASRQEWWMAAGLKACGAHERRMRGLSGDLDVVRTPTSDADNRAR